MTRADYISDIAYCIGAGLPVRCGVPDAEIDEALEILRLAGIAEPVEVTEHAEKSEALVAGMAVG